jgi:hypothetical protein
MPKVRISSTTGLILQGLGDILRKQWGLDIVRHEAWTIDLEPRAKWEDCPGGKTCSHSTYEWEWNPDTGGEFHPTECLGHPFEMEVYLAIGSVQVRDEGTVQLRAVIQITDWDSVGKHYSLRIWAKGKKKFSLSGSFELLDDGSTYVDNSDSRMPTRPPNSMAFWKTGTIT